jgi:hypothetical protein
MREVRQLIEGHHPVVHIECLSVTCLPVIAVGLFYRQRLCVCGGFAEYNIPIGWYSFLLKA